MPENHYISESNEIRDIVLTGDEPIDEETGLPIIYDENLPDLFKRAKGLTVEQIALAVELDGMTPLSRATRGAEDWNIWVLYKHDCWLTSEQNEEFIFRRFKDYDNRLKIDFGDGQARYADNYYRVDCSDFTRFVFPGDAFFEKANFVSTVKFDKALFAGRAVFKGAVFEGDAWFQNAVFGHETSFEEALFKRCILSTGATFGGWTLFEKVTFCGAAVFDSVVFAAGSVFAETVYKDEARFSKAKFEHGAVFHDAVFSGKVSRFDNIVVENNACFPRAVFEGNVWFDNANFGKCVWFDKAVFKGTAGFERASFHGETVFKMATFNDVLNIDNCCFFSNLLCVKTEFNDTLNSNSIVCLGYANYSGAIFIRSANFRHSLFLERASFINTKFNGYVDLDYAEFGWERGKQLPSNHRDWPKELLRCFSDHSLKFDSKSVPNFLGAQFSIAPNLSFTEVPTPSRPMCSLRWYERLFVDTATGWRIGDTKASTKYRRLQELAALGHYHLAEKRFFREELLSRRGHEAKSWREVLMINMFEWVCECGMSIKQPIKLWVLSLLLAVVFYGLNSSLTEIGFNIDDLGHLVNYTLSNATPIFGVLKSSDSAAVQALFGGLSPWMQFFSGVHNFVSSVFLFFALLAVRNYFKLG